MNPNDSNDVYAAYLARAEAKRTAEYFQRALTEIRATRARRREEARVIDAIARGYDYARAPAGEYKPIKISQAVVVRNGTEAGRPTVDFVLTDETGQKYVVMLTGALVKAIPCG